MTLREQITAIGNEAIGEAYVEAAGFTRTVSALAELAFIDRWEESNYTRAIRKACLLLRSPGWIDSTALAEE